MIPFSRETNRILLFNLIPFVLTLLFNPLSNQTLFLLWWTETALPFLLKPIRHLTAMVSFSIGELVLMLLFLFVLVEIPWRIYETFHKGYPLVHPWEIGFVSGICLWFWAGITWLWNPLYYVPSLAEKANIDTSPYAVEELIALTHFFAQGANTYSTQVTRNQELNFAVAQEEYFQEALDLYQGQRIQEDFPFLLMDNVQTKSIRLSYLQSYFGFTGVYNPYTGEANINTHAPAVLQPATIAHEMAHQRFIAPELEANFLSVVACLDSNSPTYQYSGYLFGLIQLSNALYPVDNEAWLNIVNSYFTPEITADWEENYEYWQGFQSPVEEVAKEVYDGFLKSNDQELGIRSYGACVDLLVAYFRQDAQAFFDTQAS